MLPYVYPLFLYGFQEGRSPTAEDTGSLKESRPIPLSAGGFSGGNSRQPAADNA